VLDARVLYGDLHAPYVGSLNGQRFGSFGFGPRREYLTGLPHFQSTVFGGAFPLAEVAFKDDRFPGQVSLRAFNPFIPLNDRDSGIPAAFLDIEVTHTTASALDYTLAATLANPLPANAINRYTRSGDLHLLHLDTDGLARDDVAYGNLALATDAADVTCQPYWFRGMWFDSLEVYWREFSAPGRLKERVYDPHQAGPTTRARSSLTCASNPARQSTCALCSAGTFPTAATTGTRPRASARRRPAFPRRGRTIMPRCGRIRAPAPATP
jgi:hypothetical protein